MKRFYLILFSVLSISLCAQESHVGIPTGKPAAPKFHKYLTPSAAFSYSVINNRKEIRGQYKPGINFGLSYVTHPWFSWSAEYSWFFPHKSSPGFENIKAWNTEVNGNLLMGAATSDLKFRFLFGMSYLNWQGTFVGPSLNDNKSWYVGKLIKQEWIGGNMGVGVSHMIGNHFSGYGDFRMRFASEKRDLISISDTSFLFGVKWEPSFKPKVDKVHKKSSSANPSRIYRWLKKRGK